MIEICTSSKIGQGSAGNRFGRPSPWAGRPTCYPGTSCLCLGVPFTGLGRPSPWAGRPTWCPRHFQPLVRSTDSGSPVDRPAAICQLCLFCLVAWFSKFNRFVLFPYLLLSFVIDFDDLFSSGILGISISMDSVSISLDFIHVFECES